MATFPRLPFRMMGRCIAGCLCLWCLGNAAAATVDAQALSDSDVQLFLLLAKAAESSYDDAAPGIVSTPAGAVALATADSDGNLIIAFRGSMVTDRSRRGPFTTFGGATMRRNYRDWAATNIKQAAGFLPRQYLEAAELAEQYLRGHPPDKKVFITGHSKGGGMAVFAAVSACLSADMPRPLVRRMGVATFNGSVVRTSNWRRLFRRHGDAVMDRAAAAVGETMGVFAVRMRDDSVSQFADGERAEFETTIILDPVRETSDMQQHGIGAVIEALEHLLPPLK